MDCFVICIFGALAIGRNVGEAMGWALSSSGFFSRVHKLKQVSHRFAFGCFPCGSELLHQPFGNYTWRGKECSV
jgi:hypothetical protein